MFIFMPVILDVLLGQWNATSDEIDSTIEEEMFMGGSDILSVATTLPVVHHGYIGNKACETKDLVADEAEVGCFIVIDRDEDGSGWCEQALEQAKPWIHHA
ncbi:hypothetical protein HMPREF2975_08215 [Actinomyces sp. HMSC065F12]|nr:hypothetical protein HMPREF2975_08215 [Actinomyces sp. HMSC065F12]